MEQMKGMKISIQIEGAEVYKDAPFLVDIGTDYIILETEIDENKKLIIKVEQDEGKSENILKTGS